MSYYNNKSFLEDQISQLQAPLSLPEKSLDALAEGDEKWSQAAADRIVSLTNQRRKAFYRRIFTQQAKKHVLLQMHSAYSEQMTKKRTQLQQLTAQASVTVDPRIPQVQNQSQIRGLSDEELAEHARLLSKSAQRPKLKLLLSKLRAAQSARVKYHALRLELAKFDNIQQNLASTNSPLLDELAMIRTLCVRLGAKVETATDSSFYNAINH
uniref:ARAD1D25080p n=1 Tax=Blastobotrys adeninivorans TaxID=409370 RepID=A0A060TB47_BLAAD